MRVARRRGLDDATGRRRALNRVISAAAAPDLAGKLPRVVERFVAAIALSALGVYSWRTGWTATELLRSVAGAVLLWAPLAMLLHRALRREVSSGPARLTISLTFSYALTTLLYFTAATWGAVRLFYLAQGGLSAWFAYRVLWKGPWRRWLARGAARGRVDWILIALIAVSLNLTVPAKTPLQIDSVTGALSWVGLQDQLYHAGLSYELGRHVPPRQASIRAGTPERAYHHFMHLTTVLLGQWGGQPDLLRVQMIHHYTVVEVLMGLALHALVATLTGSHWAGYMAVALMYVVTLPFPPLVRSDWPFYFFTLFPDYTSGLEPVLFSIPQLYTALPVMYGVLLASLLMARALERDVRSPILAVITGLVVGALTRFRIHVALVVVPGFLLLMLYAWRRSRSVSYLAGAGAALIVALLLIAEMRSPAYLPGTTTPRVGYNRLAELPTINAWPFASVARGWLARVLGQGEVQRWAWQAFSLASFTALNVVGIPLLLATVLISAAWPRSAGRGVFVLLVSGLAAGSFLAGVLLTMDYDAFSLGGQMPLHARWYLFPLGPAAMWWGYRWLQRRLAVRRGVWLGAATATLVVFTLVRLWMAPSPYVRVILDQQVRLSPDEWEALSYVRAATSPDSVVLSNRYFEHRLFLLSGLTGRAAYLEAPGNPLDLQARRVRPEDDRVARLSAMWTAPTAERFCALLVATPVTHLIEFVRERFRVRWTDCLRPLWTASRQTAIIWQVRR